MNRFGAIGYSTTCCAAASRAAWPPPCRPPASRPRSRASAAEKVFETAVGFKNFRAPLSQGEAIMAYEESDGISFGGHTLEKCALAGFLSAVDRLASSGRNLSDLYLDLRKEYGWFYPGKGGADVKGVSVEAWQRYKDAVMARAGRRPGERGRSPAGGRGGKVRGSHQYRRRPQDRVHRPQLDPVAAFGHRAQVPLLLRGGGGVRTGGCGCAFRRVRSRPRPGSWIGRAKRRVRPHKARFAGYIAAGRFHRGVQGQQIGLKGDFVDRLYDLGGFVRIDLDAAIWRPRGLSTSRTPRTSPGFQSFSGLEASESWQLMQAFLAMRSAMAARTMGVSLCR